MILEVSTSDLHFIATEQDLIGVQELQSAFNRETVGLTERGFLTYVASLSELYDINEELGIIVVRDGLSVVGYNILMTAQRGAQSQFFSQMVERYQEYSGLSLDQFALSAQCCVHPEFRGGRSLKDLYNAQRELLAGRYLRAIAEIDVENKISLLTARKVLGGRPCFDYEHNGIVWRVFERDE
jgi:hypothetical protein